jgi:hypothetical protein
MTSLSREGNEIINGREVEGIPYFKTAVLADLKRRITLI